MYFPARDESIWVGVLRLGLVVPGSRGLNDKRRGVSHVRDRLRSRDHLSVAEVGLFEDRQRSVLAVAMVSSDAQHLRSTLDALANEIEGWGRVLVESRALVVDRPPQPHDDWSSDSH
jgi:uncharacterized protein YlxP (DUF503 family)